MDKKPETGIIKIEFKKKNPKKNAKSYNIETVQDIFDVVDTKNIKKFLKEFEAILRSGILLKSYSKSIDKIEFKNFIWTDD